MYEMAGHPQPIGDEDMTSHHNDNLGSALSDLLGPVSKVIYIPTVPISEGEKEQNERIKENVKDYHENPEDYTFNDFEEMFEDRDPFEFF